LSFRSQPAVAYIGYPALGHKKVENKCVERSIWCWYH